MNELLCGNGRYISYPLPRVPPWANSTSNVDPKHYEQTWARVKPEADDAGYAVDQQSEQPSDQVPTEANAKRSHNLAELEIADQPTHCRITPYVFRLPYCSFREPGVRAR